MDISKYIVELLYDHDCVIIPGFGGFVCNYKPAEIDPVQHLITPPSKSVSFNKNLRTNDGLLLNYIATREAISFDEAFISVYAWVGSSNSLLLRGEEVRVDKVGTLCNNIEGNLQFIPDTSLNFLKSSFGLKTILAQPILRVKTTASKAAPVETAPKQIKLTKNTWRIAAGVLLLAALVAVIQLARMGSDIPIAHTDEAGVSHTLSNVFDTPKQQLRALPGSTSEPVTASITPATSVPEATTTEIKTEPTAVFTASSSAASYYVVIGAFVQDKNIEHATARLKVRFPNNEVLVERSSRLTRVAYSVGTNYEQALAQLKTAQQENNSYWLLKKDN